VERRSGWVETARDAVVRRTPAVNHLLCWCLNVYGRRWRLGEIQLLDGGFHRSAER